MCCFMRSELYFSQEFSMKGTKKDPAAPRKLSAGGFSDKQHGYLY